MYLESQVPEQYFTQSTGCNLNKYIRRVRMEKACELLLDTNMKVSDISQAVDTPIPLISAKPSRKSTEPRPTVSGRNGTRLKTGGNSMYAKILHRIKIWASAKNHGDQSGNQPDPWGFSWVSFPMGRCAVSCWNGNPWRCGNAPPGNGSSGIISWNPIFRPSILICWK